MTASAFTNATLTLPPAFLGQTYEVALGVANNAAVITASAAVSDNGLPAGIVINADGTRLTGTPTGAASAGGSGGANIQSGVGIYKFTVTPANGSGTAVQFLLPVYAGPDDPNYLEGLSVTAQSNLRDATDQ